MCGERTQHVTDHAAWSTREVVFGDDRVGDVAARSAAHQDLGADAACAIDDVDPQSRCMLSSDDRGSEPGRAAADDDEVDAANRCALLRYGCGRWVHKMQFTP